MPLKPTLSRHWFRFQRELFPWLEEALGPLGERYQRLVRVLELVRVEELLPYRRGWRGRPLEDRAALALAFLAKAVLDIATRRGMVGQPVNSVNVFTRLYLCRVERLMVPPLVTLYQGGFGIRFAA